MALLEGRGTNSYLHADAKQADGLLCRCIHFQFRLRLNWYHHSIKAHQKTAICILRLDIEISSRWRHFRFVQNLVETGLIVKVA